jgi:PPM family protein phosphatase
VLEAEISMKNRSFGGITDPGIVRSVNQDSYYIDPQQRFVIVADGMGGHAGGQEASQIATKTIQAHLEEHWNSELSAAELLQEAITAANDNIIEDQVNNPERQDMGTTLVIVLFREDGSWYTHIGDSRLYRFREQKLAQVTEDHTWVARAMKMGDLSEEEAKTHPWRHVLFQCLGRRDLPSVTVSPLEVCAGDSLILCSDGLTEEVSDEEISDYLQKEADCQQIVENLVEAAKKAGGSDNITVVMVTQA